ncbi:LysR family transcriptional regulator [Acetobacter lambici]|uniref:LysR substrate-binding domain-containing protein n=1 Tax=Acetobacter lambici TaxID=1332824 RepID=A0ABT1F1M2_9PROT|nr:LysR substrate-binding domain-containing protein [Acetobacter lambici]MCP1242933.1 LysR substrate-binding domain-containing protein [Acetobacter lambici]MCP1259100.1 LysR substrate-binding domain-containing protein [Acetobacter lambici]NHO57498.1 LysR family transcriptional regulator [Acetobacter lambici]
MTPNQIEYLLRSLRILETIGRCGSFSAAAAELGMSQPAISQQVAQLEGVLGLTLFRRLHRGVAPSDAGQILHTAAADVLARLHAAMQTIDSCNAPKSLTVLTDYGFAANWLLPRLSDFEGRYPELDLCLLTTQARQMGGVSDQADISILFGKKPDAAGGESLRLFAEEAYPICSPRYLEQMGVLATTADLARGRLLDLDSPAQHWFTWQDWFLLAGQSARPAGKTKNSLLFGNYPLLLQAILQGQGIGLGWRPLIDDYLQSGQIVLAWPEPIRSERGYFLSINPDKKNRAAAFRHWLLEQVQTSPFVRA